tara:strand:+ start:191891 stop:192427 length:537 start_codon:yes stop_codon:yes gene_type:complete
MIKKVKENLNMKKFDHSNTRPVGVVKEDNVKETTQFLNHILANEYALFTKTLNYHWTVTGPRFKSLHTFLEGHYESILAMMDGLAERVRVLGETPVGTVKEMKSVMDIDEVSGKELNANEMLADLYSTHMNIQESIKEFIRGDKSEEIFESDPGTEDHLVGVLQKHEMMSWMIKSHLD